MLETLRGLSSLSGESTWEESQHRSLPGGEPVGKARQVANTAVISWEEPWRTGKMAGLALRQESP